jgi:hypothetical protein
VVWIDAADCVAVPAVYLPDFRSDPREALLKFGSLPQRARAPWFTQVGPIDECMLLPDVVCGPRSERHDVKLEYRSLVATTDETGLLDGISPHFHAADHAYWHVHIDNALGKRREGDSAGIAMGRVSHSYAERSVDDLRREYVRIVRTFEVPLVAQVIAPVGDQIYLGAITRFVLQLKQLRGFNITSFSIDGFESAQLQQELMLAGLVTAGMHLDENTGEVYGLPKPYSVDRSPQAYKDLLESINEVRVALPRYALLRRELRELEFIEPGKAPDHPRGDGHSKDVADAVAGVVGYLSVFGHAELQMPESQIITPDEVRQLAPEMPDFRVDDVDEWNIGNVFDHIDFNQSW